MANLRQLKESVKEISSSQDSQYKEDNIAKQNDSTVHHALKAHGITAEKISGVYSKTFGSQRKVWVPSEHQAKANAVIKSLGHDTTHRAVSSTTMGGRFATGNND